MPGGRGPRWGFHELDARHARRFVAEAGVRRGDVVLDVGAGTGSLTRALVEAGARVVAVELHPVRARLLAERFAGQPVTVVRADATDLRLPRRPYAVVANPPFAVTTALVRRLLCPGSRLVRADLVVPWHAGRRWTSPDAPGRGRWGAAFTTRTAPAPPRSAFRPPPPGGVAHLVVERRR